MVGAGFALLVSMASCDSPNDVNSETSLRGENEAALDAATDLAEGKSEDLCEFREQLEGSDAIQAITGESPTDYRVALETILVLVERMKELSPPPVADDLGIIVQPFIDLGAFYERFGYDSAAIAATIQADPAALDFFDTDPRYSAANERLASYFAETCGAKGGLLDSGTS